MNHALALAAAPLALSLASCGAIVIPRTTTPEERQQMQAAQERISELERVADWMTGSFTSAEQSVLDPDFLEINLHMARIWTERTDGKWFYVEQAMASRPDRPYRQRVYRLIVQPNGLIVSEVFTLPGEPLRFAGAWKRPELLRDLSPKELALLDGCAVVLQRISEIEYKGGTVGNGCASDLRGASYATSEVTITPEGLLTLDRGFDKNGEQVWGSTKGPYQFLRMTPR